MGGLDRFTQLRKAFITDSSYMDTGPQVYGCVACPADASDQLKAIGFAGMLNEVRA